ncbi:hypothetical protein [Endozoicomonas sp. 8E]|uniref:hypothetical protein n=1 Tax=Endozoicomonas sp. 8E TaxID=3035692 RepID=UPI0029390C99|nr:hypothetical protein [Endozoicomonas sp. 8E]WOG29928.1 hypothetical protein P6910_09810 [Endozoicomonas sp. 8E]
MFYPSSIHHRSLLLDSVLLYSLVQVQNTDALTTFFQTTFSAQDNSYSLIAEGEVATDINSSQITFKLSDNPMPLLEMWNHPERLSFTNKQSLCHQVSSPYLGETSVFALLIDNCLLSGVPLNYVTSELKENSFIWLDIPTLKPSGSNKGITPVFRITRFSSNESQLILKAQPLNCDQCPYRPKSGRSSNKCCGGCEDSSKSMIFDPDTDSRSLSSTKTREHFFEPIEIKYITSTNEVHFDFNTTQGVFTTKLFQHPYESPISEGFQPLAIPLALLLSATTLVQSRTKE